MNKPESQWDKNISKLEAQLARWHARLDEMGTKATVAGEQAKADYRRQLDEVKKRIEAAQVKLEQAKEVGSEKWDILRQGVEDTWKEIERALKKLVH